MRDENVLPHFEKRVKVGNFIVFKRNTFLMTHDWKGLLTGKIITLKIGVYDVPG